MLEQMRLGSFAATVGLLLWLSASPAFGQSCPSNAPLYCGPGCCPAGNGGRTDVCCAGNLCTRDGNCSNGGSNNGGGGDVCPSNAPLPCGNGCCPYGDGGRTDVCCSGTSCTRNGTCGGASGGGQVTSTITQAGDLVCNIVGNGACAIKTCNDGTTCTNELNGVRICSGSCGAFDACIQQAGQALAKCAQGNAPSTTTTTNTSGGGSTTTSSPGGGSTTSRPGGSTTTTSCSKPCKNLCCGVGTQCMYSVEGEPLCLAPRSSSSSDYDDGDDPASCSLDSNGPVSNGDDLPVFALSLVALSLVGAARMRRRSVHH